MPNRNILDFRAQAEQMMRIIEHRLKQNQRSAGVELLILKFKTLYAQGVGAGQRYEQEGVYPYTIHDEKNG